MSKKFICIMLITISLSFAGCVGGGSSSSIPGMKIGDGLK